MEKDILVVNSQGCNSEIRIFSAKYMVIEIDPDPMSSPRAILQGGGVLRLNVNKLKSEF